MFTLQVHTVHCQTLHIDSTRFITGIRPVTGINYTIPASDKGLLFVGSSSYDPGGIIPFIPYGNSNVLIGKIDSNGQIEWIKVYGGSDDDGAVNACQTPDGGYAVLCGTASNNGDVTGLKGAADIWLLRLDATGNLLWQKTYGSSQSDGAASIANTNDGGFIILGTSNGSGQDVPFHYGSFWTFDWLVIKIDSSGALEWSKTIGGTGHEQCYGSILQVDSNYYVISSSSSTNYDCTDTSWHPSMYTYDNYFVIKLNDTGKVLWNKSYGGSNSDISYDAIYDSGSHALVITGIANSSDYMVTGNHGQQDIWTIKVDTNGSLIWQKAIGTVNDDVGKGLCFANEGGYALYGSTRNSIGGGDGWLFLMDTSGNVTSDKIFGGSDNELPASVVPFMKGFVVTGLSVSTSFTEGISNGRYASGQAAYLSYIGFSALSVKDITVKSSGINAYPNPSHTKMSVACKSNTNDVKVLNFLGQVVYQQYNIHSKDTIEIDVTEWTPGLYVIQLWDTDGGIVTDRLIKE